ncbi:MAG: tetratricopeptide repeat protein [bacterium]|nr:tetratricopeptide repeat protein [bacterium]
MPKAVAINDSRLFSKSFQMFLRQKQPWLKNSETASLIQGWLLLNQAQIHITASNQILAGQKLDQIKDLPILPAGLETDYLLARCNLYNQFNCLEELSEYLTMLEILGAKAESPPVRAQCLYYRASMEASGGDYPKASGHYLEALRTQEIRDDRDFTAEIYNDLGFCSNRMGNGGQAEEYYKISLRLRKDTGNLSGQAESLNNLGSHFIAQKQFDQAGPALLSALQLERSSGDKMGEGYTLLNLGVLAFGRGQYKKARDLYLRALELRKNINDILGLGFCYNHLCYLSLILETPEQACQNARAALDCFARAGDIPGTLQMEFLLINALLERDNISEAKARLESLSRNFQYNTLPNYRALRLKAQLKMAVAGRDFNSADALWVEYVKINPDYPASKEGLLLQGRLLAGENLKDRAGQKYSEAFIKYKSLGEVLEEGITLFYWGSLAPGTKPGRETLKEAKSIFHDLAAFYWEQKTDELLNLTEVKK